MSRLNLPDGVLIGAGGFLIEFSSSFTIYEHRVVCTSEPYENNLSVNPSILSRTNSGSYSGSYYVDLPEKGPVVRDLMASGAIDPYVTTIGLYDPSGSLVAVGKLGTPIQRMQDQQLTFVVRFDT